MQAFHGLQTFSIYSTVKLPMNMTDFAITDKPFKISIDFSRRIW